MEVTFSLQDILDAEEKRTKEIIEMLKQQEYELDNWDDGLTDHEKSVNEVCCCLRDEIKKKYLQGDE